MMMIRPLKSISIGGRICTIELYQSGLKDLSLVIIDNDTETVVDTVKADCATLLQVTQELCFGLATKPRFDTTNGTMRIRRLTRCFVPAAKSGIPEK